MDDRESLVGRRGRSAWLAAPPLIILLAIVAAFVIIGLASEFITRLAGAQASDNFVADVITRFGMPMLFAPLAIFAYALVALARWRSARRRGGADRSSRATLAESKNGGESGRLRSHDFRRNSPREKAVGIDAGGLLLQLPVPGARFRCNSMRQVSRIHV